jgi:hypothetical protein
MDVSPSNAWSVWPKSRSINSLQWKERDTSTTQMWNLVSTCSDYNCTSIHKHCIHKIPPSLPFPERAKDYMGYSGWRLEALVSLHILNPYDCHRRMLFGLLDRQTHGRLNCIYVLLHIHTAMPKQPLKTAGMGYKIYQVLSMAGPNRGLWTCIDDLYT